MSSRASRIQVRRRAPSIRIIIWIALYPLKILASEGIHHLLAYWRIKNQKRSRRLKSLLTIGSFKLKMQEPSWLRKRYRPLTSDPLPHLYLINLGDHLPSVVSPSPLLWHSNNPFLIFTLNIKSSSPYHLLTLCIIAHDDTSISENTTITAALNYAGEGRATIASFEFLILFCYPLDIDRGTLTVYLRAMGALGELFRLTGFQRGEVQILTPFQFLFCIFQ